MEIVKTLIWIVEIISAIGIVILVLLQHGKGADAGATFGSGGGSGSLFGASGSANFLSRITAVFATVFFITTFALVLLLSHGRVGDAGVMAGLSNKASASTAAVATSNKVAGGKEMSSAGAAKVAGSNNKSAENQIPQ